VLISGHCGERFMDEATAADLDRVIGVARKKKRAAA
jgi:hypothetical protein